MKKQQIPDDVNSTFVNVTLSIKTADGKYPLYDLMKSSEGWWVMTEDVASKIKYVFPVKSNKVLGVFEVKSYESAPDEITGNSRINFKLKMLFEESTSLLESANKEISKTHFVTKHFKI